MITYDVILDGYQVTTHAGALEWANGFVFCECSQSDQDIKYDYFIGTVQGIDVYYDYGADYYFFTDEETKG